MSEDLELFKTVTQAALPAAFTIITVVLAATILSVVYWFTPTEVAAAPGEEAA